MANPAQVELFHAERTMDNLQASPLCNAEVLAQNLA
jgi:hypothetical protein